ncbi:MAG: dockerin type I repeat-containing protein [Planctomycetota bacterium]
MLPSATVRSLSLLLAFVTMPILCSAQFNPTLSTSFDNLQSGLPSGFTQEAFFAEGNEGPSSLLIQFDRGSFSFNGYVPGQLAGGLVVDIFVPTPLLDIAGLIIAEVQVTSVGATSMQASAVVTEITGNVAPGLALLGIPDPTGQVAFNVLYTDLAGDSGAIMDVSDAGSLPLGGALGFNVPLSWSTPAILTHSPFGGTLNVSTLLTSSSGSQASFSEDFILAGGIDPPPAVNSFTCSGSGEAVLLEWNNPEIYDSIELRRNGSLLNNLAGDTTSYLDQSPEPGTNSYEARGVNSGLASDPASCSAVISIPENRITAVSLSTAPGSQFDISITGNLELATEGFAFPITFDPAVALIESASVNGTASASADFLSFDVDAPAGIATVSLLMDFNGVSTIPAGTEVPICFFQASVDESVSNGTTTNLTLPVAAGSPPVEAVIVQNGGAGYAPLRTNGVLTIEGNPASAFIRGDSNSDATVDIADAVAVLDYLFSAGTTPSCMDASDANDDESVNVADAVQILDLLFSGGGPLPAPGTDTCGIDSTSGTLDCQQGVCP